MEWSIRGGGGVDPRGHETRRTPRDALGTNSVAVGLKCHLRAALWPSVGNSDGHRSSTDHKLVTQHAVTVGGDISTLTSFLSSIDNKPFDFAI